jgi:hypothetical protein
MLWFSFDDWEDAGGELFLKRRIYWKNTRWTPFVRVFWRYCNKPPDRLPTTNNAPIVSGVCK